MRGEKDASYLSRIIGTEGGNGNGKVRLLRRRYSFDEARDVCYEWRQSGWPDFR